MGASDERPFPPLFGSDMLTDPYAYVRTGAPGRWRGMTDEAWLVTRYDDVRWALGEPKLSSTMPSPAADSADGSSDLLADMYTFVKSSLVFHRSARPYAAPPTRHCGVRPSVINDLSGRSPRSPTSYSTGTLARSMPRRAPGRADADRRTQAAARCRYRSLKALSSNR